MSILLCIICFYFQNYGNDNVSVIKIDSFCHAVPISDLNRTINLHVNELYFGTDPGDFNQLKEKKGGRVISLHNQYYYLTYQKNPNNYHKIGDPNTIKDSVGFEKIKDSYLVRVKRDNRIYFIFDFSGLKDFDKDTIYIRKINGELLAKISSSSKKVGVKAFQPQALRIHIPNTPTIVDDPDWDNLKYDLTAYEKFTDEGGTEYYYEKASSALYTLDSKQEPQFQEKVDTATVFISQNGGEEITFQQGGLVRTKIKSKIEWWFYLVAAFPIAIIGIVIWIIRLRWYKLRKPNGKTTKKEVSDKSEGSDQTQKREGEDSEEDKDKGAGEKHNSANDENSNSYVNDSENNESSKTTEKKEIQKLEKIDTEKGEFRKMEGLLNSIISKIGGLPKELDDLSNQKNNQIIKSLNSCLKELFEGLNIKGELEAIIRKEFERLADKELNNIRDQISPLLSKETQTLEIFFEKKFSDVDGKIKGLQSSIVDTEEESILSEIRKLHKQKIDDEIENAKEEVKNLKEVIYKFPDNQTFRLLFTNYQEVFDSIATTEQKVKEKLETIKRQGQVEEKVVSSQILEKYYSTKPIRDFELWNNILSYKATVNTNIINQLKKRKEEDLLPFIKSFVFNNVLSKSLSGLFILLSELSKLSNITGAESHLANEIQSWSSKERNELNQLIQRNLNFQPILIDLFENRRKYEIQKIGMDNLLPASAYLEKITLPDNHIREIVQIGFSIKDNDIRTAFNNMETTFKNS